MSIYYFPPPPFMGGAQPHAPRVLPPPISAVEVDNPPSTFGGPVVLALELAAITQPDPWSYNFLGGRQPFEPKKLSPGIPGQDVDNPPFSNRAATPQQNTVVSITQPDPWVYLFHGSRQPFAPRNIAPGVPGQSIDNPPSTFGGPVVLALELAAIAQPDPWTYNFLGSAQPYGPRLLGPQIPGRDVDNPPFTLGGPLALKLQAVAVSQPDWSSAAWPYTFMGGRQPYAPRVVPPATAAVVVSNFPFTSRERSPAFAAIRSTWNPPPPDFQMVLYTPRDEPQRSRPSARGYIIL
jgi:hypothetical protein